MLTLTRKTDYALIALTHLSQNKETCTSAREIATLYGLPLPLLMNVLKLLGQQGLAKSIRGPKGGYRLALPASEITLHDIILAVEGPIQLVQCIGHESDHAEYSEAAGHADDPNGSHDDLVVIAGGVEPAGQRSEAAGQRSSPPGHEDGDHPNGSSNARTGDDSMRMEPKNADGEIAGGCELMCTCPVRHPIHRIQSKLVEFVQSVTLADVAESNGVCQSDDSIRALTS